jgi:hypothetical protein
MKDDSAKNRPNLDGPLSWGLAHREDDFAVA